MTFRYINDGETGTNGATVTTGNSGGAGSDAFSGVLAAPVYDTAQKYAGTKSIKVQTAVNERIAPYWAPPVTTARTFGRCYLRVGTMPPGSAGTILEFNSIAQTRLASVSLTVAGKVLLKNSAGTTLATSSLSLVVNTWYRIEWDCTIAVSTGALQVKIFTSPDSTSPAETLTATGAAFLQTSLGCVLFGSNSGVLSYGPIWFDGLELNDTGYPGPLGSGTTELVGSDIAAGADAAATLAVAASGSDTAGSGEAVPARAAVGVTEAGQAGDTVLVRTATGSDAVTSVDVFAGWVRTATDTASAAEALLGRSIAAPESATAGEAASVTVAVAGAETGAGTETTLGQITPKSGADTAAAIDATVAAARQAVDTASGVDSHVTVAAAVTASDVAATLEQAVTSTSRPWTSIEVSSMSAHMEESSSVITLEVS